MRRAHRVLKGMLAVAGIWLLAGGPAQASFSRDLQCGKLGHDREAQICKSIERELEWTWTGHAIFSPGWRPSFGTARHVYCELPIVAEDALALARMTEHRDWRVQTAAQWLLNLLGRAGIAQLKHSGGQFSWLIVTIESDITAPASIFNPGHPSYVLRDGCPRR